ncbi:MAG: hypothetical protein HYY18_06460 [Planctomycetes bacterium]|nr:hypothetical protein [Planctomycetota bacterium]
MTKNPRKLYIETSVWKRLADPAMDWRRRATFRFLRTVGRHHQLLVSHVVRKEIDQTPDQAERKLLRRRLYAASPGFLTPPIHLKATVMELLASGGWSERKFQDMQHLAFAILSKADALVSWDVGDLARPKTRRIVEKWCRGRRLDSPFLGTPLEVARWLGFEIG